MILTTVILVLLIGCWVNGTNRGLLGMLISTCTYLISWLAAKVGARFWAAHWLTFCLRLAAILPARLVAVS